ncbi:hypothetical protein FB565_006608 [Actinoplanes lutulentus]|uniref:Uncharacterized protein n=1 Tax=Actinoplanes lutulentus TaxID=1287878 RepID=A0A327ZAL6_9ACTN|nr:hypothetical protein [Actinoplanes lutulentus]MBB2946840.1 hypothetical protein [Actinoplanes lutulentus]RAK35734.1 hypothetical protein B0I29_109208 [Actinoplanes lutulentus]
MYISAATTAASWSSAAAWSRLQSSRTKLAESISAGDVAPSTVTAIRATIENAAAQVSRIESARANDVARIRAAHQVFDLYV